MTRDSKPEKDVIATEKVPPANHEFDVFLSYSSKDEEFGRKLEEALENYRLPKDVKTSLVVKNRLNVFRDKKDLVPREGDYFKTIAGYLKRSTYLVVICSPNARQSTFVNDEITAFLQSHPADRMIPILLSGRPNNDSEASPEEYAFPDPLCAAMGMPLAIQFTEFQRVRGKLNKGRYHDSWYTLLSKIFGTERAEIERLDAKRQAPRLAIFAGVSIAIIALLSVALIFAIISRQEAVRQRDHARRLLYASDMSLAQRAFGSGNWGLGNDLLKSHRPQSVSEEDLRGFEWYYLWRLYNEQVAVFEDTNDLVFSRDGTRFATATANGIKVWDASSLRETANFTLSPRTAADAENSYSSIDFSSDGRTLAYSDSERVSLLDISSGSSRELPAPGNAQTRRELPYGEESEIEHFWNLAKGGTPRFSPDGRLLAVSYGCGLVAIYDANSLQELNRLGDGPPASYCASFITFSRDGRLLAYGNRYTVNMWDTVERRELGEPEADLGRPDSVDQVESVAFSPDGKMLAIGDRSKQVVLWNISTRKVLARLKGHEGWVTALAFSQDSKTLYSAGMDQVVRLWDFSSYNGTRISAEKIKTFATLKGHTGYISSINVSPGGITATMGNGIAKLWNDSAGREFDSVDGVGVVSASGTVITKISLEEYENTTTLIDLRADGPGAPWKEGGVVDATISPDKRILVAASATVSDEPATVTEVIKLWDMSSRQELTTLKVRSIDESTAFSRDGRLFAGLGFGAKSVIVWDTVAKRQLASINSDVELQRFLVSADGKVIVSEDKDGGKIRSWDITSQKQLAAFDGPAERAASPTEEPENPVLALSPDGLLLAFSESSEVKLWQTNSSQTPIVLGQHETRGRASAITFSPDGKLIAVGYETGIVSVWDATNRAELSTFMGHRDAVTALAFSPDSRSLVSGGGARDGAVKLYGMASMRELLTLAHEILSDV